MANVWSSTNNGENIIILNCFFIAIKGEMTYYRLDYYVHQYLGTYCATSSCNKVPFVPRPVVTRYLLCQIQLCLPIVSWKLQTKLGSFPDFSTPNVCSPSRRSWFRPPSKRTTCSELSTNPFAWSPRSSRPRYPLSSRQSFPPRSRSWRTRSWSCSIWYKLQ